MKFTKQIVRPGKYLVTVPEGTPGAKFDPATGQWRAMNTITRDHLKQLADTFVAMDAAGLKVPCPWGHDLNCGPITATNNKKNSPKNNAGFWEKLYQSPTDGSLMGVVDVPLKEDAERFGTTVRECSVFIKPSYTDGTGKTWERPIVHIAAVTHPVEPGQKNFEPVKEDLLAGAMSLAMSQFMQADEFQMDEGIDAEPPSVDPNAPPKIEAPKPGAPVAGTTIQQILEVLAKLDGPLVLPADTTLENLPERLVVAASALIGADESNSEDEENNAMSNDKNKPGEIKPQPIIMSFDPANPFCVAANESKKAALKTRIDAIAKRSDAMKKVADERLLPMLENFQMSLDDSGKEVVSPLDTILMSIEAIPDIKGPFNVDGTPLTSTYQMSVLDNPFDTAKALGVGSEEEVDKIVDAQLKNSNR